LNGTFAIGDYEENTAEFNVVKSIDVQADVDPEFALQEREVFRFDRVMFGSDWPVCLLGLNMASGSLGSRRQPAVLRKCCDGVFFYETAARFYRL